MKNTIAKAIAAFADRLAARDEFQAPATESRHHRVVLRPTGIEERPVEIRTYSSVGGGTPQDVWDSRAVSFRVPDNAHGPAVAAALWANIDFIVDLVSAYEGIDYSSGNPVGQWNDAARPDLFEVCDGCFETDDSNALATALRNVAKEWPQEQFAEWYSHGGSELAEDLLAAKLDGALEEFVADLIEEMAHEGIILGELDIDQLIEDYTEA